MKGKHKYEYLDDCHRIKKEDTVIIVALLIVVAAVVMLRAGITKFKQADAVEYFSCIDGRLHDWDGKNWQPVKSKRFGAVVNCGPFDAIDAKGNEHVR